MCEAEVGAVRDIAAIGVEAARVGADIDVRRPAPRADPITARTLIAQADAIVAAVIFGAGRGTDTEAPDERNAKALVVAADAAATFGVENQVGRAVEAPAIAEPDRTFIGATAAGVGIARLHARSEARSVGKEGGRQCRSGGG